MHERIQNAFLTWGWPWFSILPLAQILGRAVFTVLAVLYYMWALVSLSALKIRLEHPVLHLYLILVIAFVLGVPATSDPWHCLSEWFYFVLFSSGSLIVLAVLHRAPEAVHQLITAFGISALAVVVVLYVMLAFKLQRPDFCPTLHMKEDNLPFLTPFLLYWVQHQCLARYRHHLLALLLACLIAFYIIFSQGRAALVGFLVALFGYATLVTAWRKRFTVPGVALVLVLAVLYSDGNFFRGATTYDESFTSTLEKFTSYRYALWRQALASPPENLWIGVGLGDSHSHNAVLAVTLHPSGKVVNVKHLHNFLFDAWYETGLTGLSALLLWLGYLLRRGARAWKKHSPPLRQQAGVLMAASLAILSNALFSYSYTSKQFAIYLFVFLVALAALDRPVHSHPHDPRE